MNVLEARSLGSASIRRQGTGALEGACFAQSPADETLFVGAYDRETNESILAAVETTCDAEQAESRVIATFPGERIVGLRFHAESQTVGVALESGAIQCVPCVPGNGEAWIAAEVRGGIEDVSWPADGDAVAVLTRDGRVVQLTAEFAPILTHDVCASAPAAEERNSVGWGRKETQFHGRAGKAAALAAPAVGTLAASDDGRGRLVWRADGQFYAVSIADSDLGRRVMLVYDRSGVLQSKSEASASLEHALCWRPPDRLLASTAVHPSGRRDVVFIQRNGLRHGEFALGGSEPASMLMWDASGVALLVVQGATASVWTGENYAYARKWAVGERFAAAHGGLAGAAWDTAEPLCLSLCFGDGVVLSVQLQRAISRDDGPDSFVAQVQGPELLLTPFSIANIPPPFAMHTLALESDIISCRLRHNQACALLETGDAVCVRAHGRSAPAVVARLGLCAGQSGRYLPISAIWAAGRVNALLRDLCEHRDVLCIAGFDGKESPVWLIRQRWSRGIGGLARLLAGDATNAAVWVQTRAGAVFPVAVNTAEIDQAQKQFPEPLETDVDGSVEPLLCETGGGSAAGAQLCVERVRFSTGNETVVSLVADGCLFVGDSANAISRDCTSFVALEGGAGLAFTTRQNELRFSAETLGGSTRAIERGSTLVTAVSGQPALVLQHPRGNLETVRPHLLVAALANKMLATGERDAFRDAFRLCRKDRVDLGLFVREPAVWTRAETLVAALDDDDDLCLLLANLPRQEHPDETTRLCDAVRRALEGSGRERPLVAACAARVPTDLAGALAIVRACSLRDRASAERVARFLLQLARAEPLYRAALATHDLQIALLVAQLAEMDPRDYLPLLQELERCKPGYRAFRIECHLERWEQALGHLVKDAGAEHWDEVVPFAARHGLFPVAYDLVSEVLGVNEQRVVAAAWAASLLEDGAHCEAGLMFWLAGDSAESHAAFLEGGCWELAAATAPSRGEAAAVCARLANSGLSASAAAECSTFALILGGTCDSTGVLAPLVTAGRAMAAFAISSHSSLQETLGKLLDDALAQWTDEAESLAAQVRQTQARLAAVRTQKAQNRQRTAEGPDCGDVDLRSDTSSMASSVSTFRSGATGLTGRSRMTSKARRKLERKRQSDKEGGAFEEVVLAGRLCDAASRVSQWADSGHLHSLLAASVASGKWKGAQNLQKAVVALFGAMDAALEAAYGEAMRRRTAALADLRAKVAQPEHALAMHSLLAELEEMVAAGGTAALPPRAQVSRAAWSLGIFAGP